MGSVVWFCFCWLLSPSGCLRDPSSILVLVGVCFFVAAPQCRCFKCFSSFYQGYIRYISYIYLINISPSLYLIVNCGVPILGESSSSLEEWRSLLGQSGCHGGERFSKEIWGQGVPWAETYGVFVLTCWLRVPIFGECLSRFLLQVSNLDLVWEPKERRIHRWSDDSNNCWLGEIHVTWPWEIGRELLGIRGKMPSS